MVDWATVSSLATAAGTLVLAAATFASVRSANRAARAAERSLLAGLRPVLLPSRLQDAPEKIHFVDGHWVVAADGGFSTTCRGSVTRSGSQERFSWRRRSRSCPPRHGPTLMSSAACSPPESP
ncbi:MAG: hypothetical protein ACXV3C_03850 [Actinomycetes bacterium]